VEEHSAVVAEWAAEEWVAEEWVAEAGSAEVVVVVVGLEADSDVFANDWIVLYVFVLGRYRVPIRRFE
jgi:hypothetical protein